MKDKNIKNKNKKVKNKDSKLNKSEIFIKVVAGIMAILMIASIVLSLVMYILNM